MKNKKTFNHAFDIGFSVSGSKYEDWMDCLEKEKEMVVQALFERLVTVFSSKEYLEAISGFDTYEETIEDNSFDDDDTTAELNEREMLMEKKCQK